MAAAVVVDAAFGDGETDATAHIQGKLDAAGDGGSVHIPAGKYLISDTLTMPSNNFQMSGVGGLQGGDTGSELWWTATDEAIPVLTHDTTTYWSNCQLSGFSIYCDGHGLSPTYLAGNDGILLAAPVNGSKIRGVYIARVRGHGVRCVKQTDNALDPTACGNFLVEQLFVSRVGGYAFDANGYATVTLLVPDFNTVGLGGVRITGSIGNQSSVNLIGGWFESGTLTGADYITVADSNGRPTVNLIGCEFAGAGVATTIIRATGAGGVAAGVFNSVGFGYTNWLVDVPNGETVAFSTPFTYAPSLRTGIITATGHVGTTMGFYGTTPTTRPVVTGGTNGSQALKSLLSALASLGLITNSAQ